MDAAASLRGPRPHGHFLAGEAGELAGAGVGTIGQWARWGYIRASQDAGDPHVYSVEDVAEAAIVRVLLERGVRHADIRALFPMYESYGDWPLSEAPLATTVGTPRPLIAVREPEGIFVLGARGWQEVVAPPPLEDVRLRLRRS